MAPECIVLVSTEGGVGGWGGWVVPGEARAPTKGEARHYGSLALALRARQAAQQRRLCIPHFAPLASSYDTRFNR